MNTRTVMWGILVLELAACGMALGRRWNSTAPSPPHVAQYTDTLTARELLALPDRFLFDSPAKWRTLAETYAAFGYFSKADGCFRQLAQLQRTTESAFYHGYCLVRLGHLDEACTEFQYVIDRHDSRFASRAWYYLGTVYLRREQPQEALHAFEQAGDGHLAALYQRAKFYVRSGQLDAATPLLAELTEQLPQDVHVCQLQAQVAGLGSHPQAAVIAARDTLELSANQLAIDDMEDFFSAIRRKIGMTREVAAVGDQRQAGEVKPAAERLASLVRDDTHWDNVYLYLLQDAAAVSLQAGNSAAARELAIRQIEQDQFPTPTAWQIRGEAEFTEQHWAQALAAWTHAERLKPDSVDHVRLATAIENLGDAPTARRHLALAGLYRAIDMFRNGDFEQARTLLRQSNSIADDFDMVWFYLGECERRLGDRTAALKAYRRCLELNPAHGRAAARSRDLEPAP